MQLLTSQLRHCQLCHSFVKGSHLLPSQLHGDHTGHKAASRCSEPIWNAHYSSTHHQCWYSFYLPTKGWRVESTPSQVEWGAGIEPGTSRRKVHCSTDWAISFAVITMTTQCMMLLFTIYNFVWMWRFWHKLWSLQTENKGQSNVILAKISYGIYVDICVRYKALVTSHMLRGVAYRQFRMADKNKD